jgi:hypothetical protein
VRAVHRGAIPGCPSLRHNPLPRKGFEVGDGGFRGHTRSLPPSIWPHLATESLLLPGYHDAELDKHYGVLPARPSSLSLAQNEGFITTDMCYAHL